MYNVSRIFVETSCSVKFHKLYLPWLTKLFEHPLETFHAYILLYKFCVLLYTYTVENISRSR